MFKSKPILLIMNYSFDLRDLYQKNIIKMFDSNHTTSEKCQFLTLDIYIIRQKCL